jgi:hypothetical protein
MKLSRLVLLISVIAAFVPAYGQEFVNTSLVLQKIDILANEFNKILDDSTPIPFDTTHAGNWQINIENDLLYGNPQGSAIIRIYDANIADKFIEIGMGSPPDRKFWVTIDDPERGLIPATRLDRDGWYEDSKVIAAYSDSQGISVGNGKRIVVSNVILDNFVVGSYAVYGMNEPTDPPAINSGTFVIDIISGDVSQNPIHYYPYYVTGAVGAIIGVLLLVKKRS